MDQEVDNVIETARKLAHQLNGQNAQAALHALAIAVAVGLMNANPEPEITNHNARAFLNEVRRNIKWLREMPTAGVLQ